MKNNNPCIKDWPLADRPREKILSSGPEYLTDSELLAILLRTGRRGVSSIDLGRIILSRFKSLRGMSKATINEFKEIKGLGSAKIAQLLAAFEIGKRFREEKMKDSSFTIASAKDVIELIKHRMRDEAKESFVIILLDARNHVIKVSVIEEGTVHFAHPIIREILHTALMHNSVSFLCVHNHPSGNPNPSREDKEFTRTLREAAQKIDLLLLDHIIVAGDEYFSFSDHNLLS
jgi:DNA repair protein RadC